MATPDRGVNATNPSGESFPSDSGSDEIKFEESYKFQKQLPMKKRNSGIGDFTDSQDKPESLGWTAAEVSKD